jgi:hypothetical protein
VNTDEHDPRQDERAGDAPNAHTVLVGLSVALPALALLVCAAAWALGMRGTLILPIASAALVLLALAARSKATRLLLKTKGMSSFVGEFVAVFASCVFFLLVFWLALRPLFRPFLVEFD